MKDYVIRDIAARDVGYVLATWRESHKKSPKASKVPWDYYKATFGALFSRLLDDPLTQVLGAYEDVEGGRLLGYIVTTPGKRVNTLHWVHVKHTLGEERLRRRGLMLALIEAAQLGRSFVYTLEARRERAPLPDGDTSRSLDQVLVHALRGYGVNATYMPLKEWMQ